MNYTACLNRAMAIFNEQMGADFSAENVVLACFDTGWQTATRKKAISISGRLRSSERTPVTGTESFCVPTLTTLRVS